MIRLRSSSPERAKRAYLAITKQTVPATLTRQRQDMLKTETVVSLSPRSVYHKRRLRENPLLQIRLTESLLNRSSADFHLLRRVVLTPALLTI